MALAIFDLDNTLLNGDSDHAWGEFLCNKGVVDPTEYRDANDRFFEQYQSGTLDIQEFLGFALRPLAKYDLETLNQWHDEFMTEVIAGMLLPRAESLIEQHRQAGDYSLIITATNRFVTAPIAKRLGVDEIMATDPEIVDGQYTGRVTGVPCFQQGKVTRLEQWLKQSGESLEGSSFYSDSINDLPLLERVDKPVAVNPDETLEKIAKERGWPILDLRAP